MIIVHAAAAVQHCDGRARSRSERGRSGQSEIGESRNVVIGRGLRKTTENHTPDAARRRGEFGRNRADGDARGAVGWKAIDAGRDCRKRERHQPARRGEIKRGAITRRQQFDLTMIATIPHRADGMNDVLGW